MSRFNNFVGIAAPIEGPNVDTDQIIPARFLKFDRASGYESFLFHDLRFDPQGVEYADYILNRQPFRGASILVANENFGCGSSREGAVYALVDYGIRVVIAPSFGDIFYTNCLRNEVLPALVTSADATGLRASLHEVRNAKITVDLPSQTITGVDGVRCGFRIESFWRDCLLSGVDEIGLAIQQLPKIEAFERAYSGRAPWLS